MRKAFLPLVLLMAGLLMSLLMPGAKAMAKESVGKKSDDDFDLFIKIIICESSGNNKGVWGDDKKSYGIAQFQKETFYELARKAGMKHARWGNAEHQLRLLMWAIRHKKAHLWSCYRKIEGRTRKERGKNEEGKIGGRDDKH